MRHSITLALTLMLAIPLLAGNRSQLFAQGDQQEKPAAAADDTKDAPANPRGPGRGRGPGAGRGPGPEMRADQDIFHFLLENHAKIRRTVTQLDDGVESLTESDDPAVAKKLQEHVASMHKRVKAGNGLRYWDDLFVQLFKHYDKIVMKVENTEKGVRVRETSTDRYVVMLIQAHAQVVSLFVKHGFDEAHKEHLAPKPTAASSASTSTAAPKSPLVFPLIEKYGGVKPLPQAAEQPRAGAKVVFDITVDSKPTDVNKGLDRVARLLNLYGAAGLRSSDVKIVVTLHGEATKSVLTDSAYKSRFEVDSNPSLPLLRVLRKAGVEVFVCGQALNYKNIADEEVAENIPVAAAALTVIINKQNDGYAYVPVP